jgi:5'-methylthioadenosine phosphorylase
LVLELPIHLKIRKEVLSPKVITVGDPQRAKKLAETILDNSRIINENRGFLSYTGEYEGERISVVTHGIGMPSAAIVFEELSMLGVKKMVRLGTTGSLRKDIGIGEVVVATCAGHSWGGTIGQYAGEIAPGNGMDPLLTQQLIQEARKAGYKPHTGPVISSDAFYAEDPQKAEKWKKLGFIAVEMECAVLATLGWMRGYKPGCMLLVTDNLALNEKGIIGTDVVNERMKDLGRIVAKALITGEKDV